MTAVLVTRPAGAGDSLVAELESRGYRVVAVPTVATRPLNVAWPTLEGFDWIVLTSTTAVEALPAVPAGPRWAVVGESTAKALRARGAEADVIPPTATGTALAAAIPDPEGASVLVVRGSLADRELPARLRDRGARVEELTVYTTVEGPAESREPLLRAAVDMVVFASGSAVRGFISLGGSSSLPAITIGPRTTAVALEHGFRVVAQATVPDVEQLGEALDRAISLEGAGDA